jgi:hypothetical protein
MHRSRISIFVLAMVVIGWAAPAMARLHNTPWFVGDASKRVDPTPTPLPPDPTPTVKPTPTTGGITPFTPQIINDVTYGAGGTALLTLNSPHVYTCTNTSSDAAGLQSAVNASGDLQIEGTRCDITNTIQLRSNQNVQCQNSATVLYDPNDQTAAFEYVNQSNSSFSNCAFLGSNTVAPSNYPGGCGCGTGCPQSGNAFFIQGEGVNSNITIVDNVMKQTEGQAAVEFYNGTTPNTNITLNWNSFYNCAGDAWTYDSAQNSSENHNYLFDCSASNELDTDSDPPLNGVTVNYNYQQRDQWATGSGYEDFGSPSCGTPTNAFSFVMECGQNDQGGGIGSCTFTGNVLNLNGYAGMIENSSGTGSNNYAVAPISGNDTGGSGSGTGCQNTGNGCTNVSTAPNPGP